MTHFDLMKERHSVRQYTDKKIEPQKREILNSFVEQCNKESGLHIQIYYEEPNAFNSFMAHYGSFKGVHNYIAIIGKKQKNFEEKCGYYGEKVVLKAQEIGLNTCWVAMTYSKGKSAIQLKEGEKLCCVIALGYGQTQGNAHKSKSIDALCHVDGEMPEWFQKGMEAAILAPTAMNQQKFMITLNEKGISAKAGLGFYTKLDLGIVKYHFELGANIGKIEWN